MTPLHLDILTHYYSSRAEFPLIKENKVRMEYAQDLVREGYLKTKRDKFSITLLGRAKLEMLLELLSLNNPTVGNSERDTMLNKQEKARLEVLEDDMNGMRKTLKSITENKNGATGMYVEVLKRFRCSQCGSIDKVEFVTRLDRRYLRCTNCHHEKLIARETNFGGESNWVTLPEKKEEKF